MSKKKSLKKSKVVNKNLESKNLETINIEKDIEKVNSREISIDKIKEINKNEIFISKSELFKLTPEKITKLVIVLMSFLLISGVFVFNFYIISEKIIPLTDTEVAKSKEREEKEKLAKEYSDNQLRIEEEGKVLNFENNKNWTVGMKFNDFDEIKINLNVDYAPKTVESFIRLTYRGTYIASQIHRIVKTDNFAVIQGGDTDGLSGTGGKSAFYLNKDNLNLIPDELWLEAPVFGENSNQLINEPKFRDDSLYTNFNKETGEVEYRKGLILMAKTSQPNSASSQFFITLDKTILPAQYTVFGVIDESSFPVLDKIFNEINPVSSTSNNPENQEDTPTVDGAPDKNIYIEEIKILEPKIES